jgi:hypothetical protein
MSTMPTESRYPCTPMESYFLKPPLLSTEPTPEYNAMVKVLSDRVKPQDEFELFWIDDYVHHSIQIRRWRRAEVAIIEMMHKDALRAILASIVECDDDDRNDVIEGHAANWFKGIKERQSVLSLLAPYGIDERHVIAKAMELHLPQLNQIERMIGDFERRRSAALRELEDYRVYASWRAPQDLPALLDAAADESETAATTGVAA